MTTGGEERYRKSTQKTNNKHTLYDLLKFILEKLLIFRWLLCVFQKSIPIFKAPNSFLEPTFYAVQLTLVITCHPLLLLMKSLTHTVCSYLI